MIYFEVIIEVAKALIRLVGELDAGSVHQLRDALMFITGSITIDVSQLIFIDAAGVSALVVARRDRSVRIVGAQGMVRRVFDIVGLEYG